MLATMSLNVVPPPNGSDPGDELHVLHVIDRACLLRLGGMVRVAITALGERNVRSTLLTEDVAAAALTGLEPDAVMVVPALHGWRAWRLGRRLADVTSPLPDVVHLWGAGGRSRVLRWAHSAGVAVVTYLTSEPDLAQVVHHPPEPRERILTAYQAQQTALLQRLPALSGSITALPPAVAMPVGIPERPTGPHTPAVVWTGHLQNAAGLPLLIEAVSLLRRQGHEVQVALVGTGGDGADAWRTVRRFDVADCFSLVDGPLFAELAITAADILVVPSKEEAVSVAPLAAIAAGAYVVSSRDQEADWFVEGRTVTQFAPGSASELSYQLTRLLEDRPDIAALRTTAREYVSKHHTSSACAAACRAAYVAAIQTPPPAEARA